MDEPAGVVFARDGAVLRVHRTARPPTGPAGFVLVRLSLYAGLGRLAPAPSPMEVAVEKGLTVGDLLDALGVPAGEARLLFVNHCAVERDKVLAAGDRVGAFPLIAGG